VVCNVPPLKRLVRGNQSHHRSGCDKGSERRAAADRLCEAKSCPLTPKKSWNRPRRACALFSIRRRLSKRANCCGECRAIIADKKKTGCGIAQAEVIKKLVRIMAGDFSGNCLVKRTIDAGEMRGKWLRQLSDAGIGPTRRRGATERRRIDCRQTIGFGLHADRAVVSLGPW